MNLFYVTFLLLIVISYAHYDEKNETIYGALKRKGGFEILLSLLPGIDLDLKLKNKSLELTFFALTNSAFERLLYNISGQEATSPKETTRIINEHLEYLNVLQKRTNKTVPNKANILYYHMIVGKCRLADLEGEEIKTTSSYNSSLLFLDNKIIDKDPTSNTTITSIDIEKSNGMYNTIQDVLLPISLLALKVMLASNPNLPSDIINNSFTPAESLIPTIHPSPSISIIPFSDKYNYTGFAAGLASNSNLPSEIASDTLNTSLTPAESVIPTIYPSLSISMIPASSEINKNTGLIVEVSIFGILVFGLTVVIIIISIVRKKKKTSLQDFTIDKDFPLDSEMPRDIFISGNHDSLAKRDSQGSQSISVYPFSSTETSIH